MLAFIIGQIAFFILFFLWELPQNIAGAILYVIMLIRGTVINSERTLQRQFIQTKRLGICLGYFVFWTTEKYGDTNRTRKHEYGHSIQSRLLGPLYLILVGIPSMARYLYAIYFESKTHRTWTKYYAGYPENWADRLGKITRNT
ncbi:MAG: hypothetical protein ABIV51_06330 [Saprospiraceae bacterium]